MDWSKAMVKPLKINMYCSRSSQHRLGLSHAKLKQWTLTKPH